MSETTTPPAVEVVHRCMVHDCGWTYDEPRQTRWLVNPKDVAGSLERAFGAERATVDAVLRAHACEHDPGDYLATIALLRQAWGTARRTHLLLAATSPATIHGTSGATVL